jgi:uncharacterized membrane protein YjgN (DUF898 family)
MRKYFDFDVNGKTIFSLFIAMYLLLIPPYVLLYFQVEATKDMGMPGFPNVLIIIAVVLLIMLIAMLFCFLMIKIMIPGFSINSHRFDFSGSFNTFLRMNIKGILLSFITLGIYLPWFIKTIYDYLTEQTSFKNSKFVFLSPATNLFVIFILALIVPLVFLSALNSIVEIFGAESIIWKLFYNFITMLALIPYYYYFYRWLVNVQYNDYTIRWDTEVFTSTAYMLRQYLLTCITFGIYFPVAMLKITKYFIGRTYGYVNDIKVKKFSFEFEPSKGFLFIWGQLLLTIITVGIYFPWAWCNITKWMTTKISFENIEIQNENNKL